MLCLSSDKSVKEEMEGEGVGAGVGVISSSEKDPIEASDENREACDGAGSSTMSAGQSEDCGGEVTRDIKGGGS